MAKRKSAKAAKSKRKAVKPKAISRTLTLGKVPPEAFREFLTKHLSGAPARRRMPGEAAGGICGEWGCALRHQGRTIKGCHRIIFADGTVRTICEY